jgi:hypothetical protein
MRILSLRPDPVSQIPPAPTIPPHLVTHVAERLAYYSVLPEESRNARRREFAADIVAAVLVLRKE